MRATMLPRLADLYRGEPNDTSAYCSLQAASAQTLVINGAAEATPIHTIDDALVTPTDTDAGRITHIRGIESAFETLARQHRLPSEADDLLWAAAAGHRDLRGYTRFAGLRDSDTVIT